MPQPVHQPIHSTTLPDRAMSFLLGQELKAPLIALKLQAESSGSTQSVIQAEHALRVIDNVLLYQRIQTDQHELELGPVHIGSALTEVLTQMQTYLDSVGCEAEVYVQHGITTVDSNRSALVSALESMLQSIVAAAKRPSPVSWHVFRVKDGIRISLTNNSVDLSTISMPSAQGFTTSTQPVQGIAGPATSLITAHGLLDALGGTMRKVHRRGGEEQGFGVTLQASAQLMLV